MNLHHLPAGALAIVGEQGWNEDTALLHLLGFIYDTMPEAEQRITAYFQEMADEENATDEPQELICNRCGDRMNEADSPDGEMCPDCHDRAQYEENE